MIFLERCFSNGVCKPDYVWYDRHTKIYSIIKITALFVLKLRLIILYKLGEDVKKMKESFSA